ncbi:MAG: uroporphyrin-3 C-methyltransferase [Limisphaerales bacterium]
MKDVSDIKSDSEMPDESKNNAEADADEQDQSDVVTEEMPTEEMPEQESVPEETPTEEKPAREKPRGRGVAWFALLVALIALGGGGYLYYEVVYKQPIVQLEARLSAGNNLQQQELSNLKSTLTQQQDSVTQQLAEARISQAQALAETEAGVLDSLQQTLLAAPPSQREWKLAEAEYLLRIGNHRVLMEQDTQGALTLFLAVDQILAELDDFALHQVRAVLADEIIALRQVPRQDLQGLYLRLEAIKGQLDQAVFKAPEYVAKQAAQDPEETVWTQLATQMKEFVRVRRVVGDEAVHPILTPTEEQFLELNLRLALEQAQLAALKRQQVVYEQALENVRSWVDEHVDDSQGVLISEIDALLSFELAHPLPNVAASLQELNGVRRGGE